MTVPPSGTGLFPELANAPRPAPNAPKPRPTGTPHAATVHELGSRSRRPSTLPRATAC